MHIKVYKDGKILLPLKLRKKFNIKDDSELIITECSDGIKISTKQMLLNSLRSELATINIKEDLEKFRAREFIMETQRG